MSNGIFTAEGAENAEIETDETNCQGRPCVAARKQLMGESSDTRCVIATTFVASYEKL